MDRLSLAASRGGGATPGRSPLGGVWDGRGPPKPPLVVSEVIARGAGPLAVTVRLSLWPSGFCRLSARGRGPTHHFFDPITGGNAVQFLLFSLFHFKQALAL